MGGGVGLASGVSQIGAEMTSLLLTSLRLYVTQKRKPSFHTMTRPCHQPLLSCEVCLHEHSTELKSCICQEWFTYKPELTIHYIPDELFMLLYMLRGLAWSCSSFVFICFCWQRDMLDSIKKRNRKTSTSECWAQFITVHILDYVLVGAHKLSRAAILESLVLRWFMQNSL